MPSNLSISDEIGAIYTLTSQGFLSRFPVGKNIFSEDWDLLIVLDACRIDAMKSVCGEFNFLPETIDSVWSQGSTSKEWVERTFHKKYSEELKDTAMITANPFAEHILRDEDTSLDYLELSDTFIGECRYTNPLIKSKLADPEDFFLLDILLGDDQVGEDTAHHHHPQEVTDHAIWVGRNENPPKCIVHYMQPHTPYFANSTTYDKMTEDERKPFEAFKSNRLTHDEIFQFYIQNLKFVLKHVSRLLKNYDGNSVVITADHGELFGEWGLYNHMPGIFHPSLRKVPWIKTEASDSKTYDSETSYSDIFENSLVSEEQLEALGYL